MPKIMVDAVCKNCDYYMAATIRGYGYCMMLAEVIEPDEVSEGDTCVYWNIEVIEIEGGDNAETN